MRFRLGLLLLLLALAGCASPSLAQQAIAPRPDSLEATAEPAPTAMPTEAALEVPTMEPAATETTVPAPTDTPSPLPTETPSALPTETPLATATLPPASPTVVATPRPRPTTPVDPPTANVVWSVGIGDELVRGSRALPLIALTFDAGAGANNAPAILAALRQYGAHSTFFMTGGWAEKFPDLLLQIAADGHEFGNHSYSHPDFTELSAGQMATQLARTEALVHEATGLTTRPWFRPPFGARDQRVLSAVKHLGYRSVFWSLDSGDWREEATGPGVLNRVLTNAVNGAIIVLHVDSAATAAVLPELIEGLQEKGFTLVKLSELVE